MVYDCIMYWNGIDLLELRLETLKNVVNVFVISEGRQGHTGLQRELEIEKHLDRLSEYNIRYLIIDKMPSQNAFENEYYQRNIMAEAINDAGPDDFIMHSDDDEIPNPVTLKQGMESLNYFNLRQKLFYYYVNCKMNIDWCGPVVIRKRDFRSFGDLRRDRGNESCSLHNGGWHYSFLGGVDMIRSKLNNYSEVDTNKPEINNEANILRCLETGEDIFHRTQDIFQKRFITIEEVGHPQLTAWLEKHPQYAH